MHWVPALIISDKCDDCGTQLKPGDRALWDNALVCAKCGEKREAKKS